MAASPQASSMFIPGPGTLAEPQILSKGPGGTLASPLRGENLRGDSSHPAPIVVVSSGGGSTLPSQDLPMLEPVTHGAPRLRRAGIDPKVLVALVVLALLAGFGIGFAVGRIT